MEIKIHGYKLEGVKYEIKLNCNRKSVESGINGGRIDMLEAKQGTQRKSWKTSRISSTE